MDYWKFGWTYRKMTSIYLILSDLRSSLFLKKKYYTTWSRGDIEEMEERGDGV